MGHAREGSMVWSSMVSPADAAEVATICKKPKEALAADPPPRSKWVLWAYRRQTVNIYTDTVDIHVSLSAPLAAFTFLLAPNVNFVTT